MVDWKASDRGKDLREYALKEKRREFEILLLALLWGGAALILIGTLEITTASFQTWVTEATAHEIGMWTASAGIIVTALSMGLSYFPERLRIIGSKTSGGDRYDRMRRWTRIKVSSILLQILGVLAIIVVGMAILALFDVFNIEEASLVTRFTVIQVPVTLTLIIAAAQAFAHDMTLRSPTERPRTGLEGMVLALTIGAATVLAFGAGVLSSFPLNLGEAKEFGQIDAPFFLLSAATALIIGLFVSRGLPTVTALITEEHRYYRGRTHLSKSKSVVMPISIAFAVLFLIVLLLVFFQLSFVGRFAALSTNVILLGFVGFILAALLVSLGASILLSRTDDEHTLFKRKRSSQERLEITILAISLSITAVLLAAAAVLFTTGDLPGFDMGRDRWLDFMAFGLLTALGPYGFYYRHQQSRIRQLEERFPDFLRDLAASRKAGLTLTSAVKVAARGEYGALTPDIQKMADQLAWNVPFSEALDEFADRVDTPLVRRAVSLINEASRSGGHVTDVLEAAARDAREIKNLENERKLNMGLYTAIIYIAFLVFLGVAATLYGTFIPEVLKTTGDAQGAAGQGFGGVSFTTLSLSDFRTFYFIASITQAGGNGAIAGMMESGKPRAGMVHAFIMVLMTYAVFTLVL